MSGSLTIFRAALAISGGFLSVATPAPAQLAGPPGQPLVSRVVAPLPPQAEVKVFSAGNEFGSRNVDLVNGTVASICVSSSTGRFRLRISSQSGGALVAPHLRQALPYSVIFRDPTGAEHVKPMTNGDVVFEAQSRAGSTCAQGANATIAVRSTDRDISAALAGEYFEQLLLSINPL